MTLSQVKPALLTMMSRPPNWSSAVCTNRSPNSGSTTLPMHGAAVAAGGVIALIGFAGRLVVHVVHDDARALARQLERDRATDSSPGAAHQRDLAVELHSSALRVILTSRRASMPGIARPLGSSTALDGKRSFARWRSQDVLASRTPT